MFYKKLTFPEEGEIVICTVKKVLYHTVFIELDEYKNKEGVIHISEISPGRIRNIRDYVKEGKKIVCKVLRVDKVKKHIDLSLRRVNISARKKKLEDYKQEQKAEKILEILAKETNKTLKNIYEEIGNTIIKEYGLLMLFFQTVKVEGKKPLLDLKIKETFVEPLFKIIKERIRIPEITMKSQIKIESFRPDGIKIIKNALKKAENLIKDKKYNVTFTYVSAPKYEIKIISADYKTAETELQEINNLIIENIKNKGNVEVLKNE